MLCFKKISSVIALIYWFVLASLADDRAVIRSFLNHPIIDSTQALAEVQTYLEARIPKLGTFQSIGDWEKRADFFRSALVEQVYRGDASLWREAPTKIEWLETISTDNGYRIKKVRFEALPGLWIPALLYEPSKIDGEVPAVLNLGGHEPDGKSNTDRQTCCINLAKRGLIALNVEWFGSGQLQGAGFEHSKLNQLDLCGMSGLAPFYLAMKRGLDLLFVYEHADADRVAVTGFSGGGWQTIFLSAVDSRVKLCNPVAGYSSLRTRARFFEDLGDSEQMPSDFGAIADYTHLTALLAPRPALLTYNTKDDCCFAAGHALPPLLEAAAPFYKLYGKEKNLRSHINEIPGADSYDKENREEFYRMLGEFFFPSNAAFSTKEIPCDSEIKTKEQLQVALPVNNLDFNKIALQAARNLPRITLPPVDLRTFLRWQQTVRGKLSLKIRQPRFEVVPEQVGADEKDGIKARFWKLKLGGGAWTVPVTELSRGESKSASILIADRGRADAVTEVENLLSAGQRVFAVDPFYFGESKISSHDYLFALMVAAIGDRPLGQQVGQISFIARWAQATNNAPVNLVAVGPRTSLIALIAAALEPRAIVGLELHDSLGSLKEIIEKNLGAAQVPEMFCFGLLETIDIKQIVALAASHPVTFYHTSLRLQTELVELQPLFAARNGKLQLKP